MNDVDLFSNIKITSSNQRDVQAHTSTSPKVADDVTDTGTDTDADTDANVDADTNSDNLKETPFDGVPLDDCSEDESEDDDFEHKDQSDKVVEATAVGVAADEMDVDEGIIAPGQPVDELCEIPLPFRAGCAWTESDWSCAYDAVFMTFFAIYWQSSPSWRDDWRRQSPEWSARLADRFDLLLDASDSQEHTCERLSTLFSGLRDQFRDQLSSFNRQRFPRRGTIPAPVCAILELLFGSMVGPGIDQHLSCTNCGATSQRFHDFPLLGLLSQQDHPPETDPRFIPSETLLTRFIEALATPPGSSRCNSCHGACEVRSLTMTNSPWIWFETNGNVAMSPSPTILIELPTQHLVYDLHSIVYHGGEHFTARMRDPSNDWWNYDGMRKFGMARRDCVQHLTDLLWNGRRTAAFFIYRRNDP